MMEADWNTCTDPQIMLTWLREQGVLSDRKARLFAVTVCRRIWPLLVHEVSRRAVVFAESLAKGRQPVGELSRVRDEADEVWACLTDAFWSNPLDPSNEYD